MKKEWLHTMRQQKRLILGFWSTINHYFIVFFFLFISGLLLYSVFQIYVTENYEGVRPAEELTIGTFPFLIAAIIFYFIQRRRLRFKEVSINYTDHDFQEAIERTMKEYEWQITNNSKSFFRAYRYWNWTGSWGEMITIIRLKVKLLLNSICNPNIASSVASFGWNKRNIGTFLKNLNDIINQIPVVKINVEKKQESEWTLKRTIVRLFIYPFCLFLIGLGFYMFLHPLSFRNAMAGVGAIIFGAFFLYLDIRIILTKNHESITSNEQKKHK
jgi:protein-S-isoprenylcysteine O-methyltransferase Ste14